MNSRSLLFFLFLLLFFFVCGTAFTQSNQLLDELLKQEKALYGHAVYLILTATDSISDDSTISDAVEFIARNKPKMKTFGPENPLRAGLFAHLTMQFFKIKGGLFYSLFPGARYALREMIFRGYINSKITMYQYISGFQVVQIIGNVKRYQAEMP